LYFLLDFGVNRLEVFSEVVGLVRFGFSFLDSRRSAFSSDDRSDFEYAEQTNSPNDSSFSKPSSTSRESGLHPDTKNFVSFLKKIVYWRVAPVTYVDGLRLPEEDELELPLDRLDKGGETDGEREAVPGLLKKI
jgi:hypothetical protein